METEKTENGALSGAKGLRDALSVLASSKRPKARAAVSDELAMMVGRFGAMGVAEVLPSLLGNVAWMEGYGGEDVASELLSMTAADDAGGVKGVWGCLSRLVVGAERMSPIFHDEWSRVNSDVRSVFMSAMWRASHDESFAKEGLGWFVEMMGEMGESGVSPSWVDIGMVAREWEWGGWMGEVGVGIPPGFWVGALTRRGIGNGVAWEILSNLGEGGLGAEGVAFVGMVAWGTGDAGVISMCEGRFQGMTNHLLNYGDAPWLMDWDGMERNLARDEGGWLRPLIEARGWASGERLGDWVIDGGGWEGFVSAAREGLAMIEGKTMASAIEGCFLSWEKKRGAL